VLAGSFSAGADNLSGSSTASSSRISEAAWLAKPFVRLMDGRGLSFLRRSKALNREMAGV
jgi:hypothetical protein